MSRRTPTTRQSSPSRTRTGEKNTNSIESTEDGEIVEKDDRSKRRKIDTVDMVDTQEEINGYLTKLRIVFDQMETPTEVEYTTPMSEAYPDQMVKATMSIVLDMKERPRLSERVRQQRNHENDETEDQISIRSWALMQRDAYNVMIHGFKEVHMQNKPVEGKPLARK